QEGYLYQAAILDGLSRQAACGSLQKPPRTVLVRGGLGTGRLEAAADKGTASSRRPRLPEDRSAWASDVRPRGSAPASRALGSARALRQGKASWPPWSVSCWPRAAFGHTPRRGEASFE